MIKYLKYVLCGKIYFTEDTDLKIVLKVSTWNLLK